MESKEGNEGSNEDIRQIIDNLLNGMSINRVPQNIHPKLLMPLSAAKNEAIVAGNTPLVKRIQGIMKGLHLSPSKTSTSNPTPRRRETKSRAAPAESVDEAADPVIEELLQGRPAETVDDSIIPQVIEGLKAKKEDLIKSGEYYTLQQVEDLINEFNSRNLESSYNSVRNEKIAQLQQQLNNAQNELDERERYWEEQRDEFEGAYNQAKEELLRQHEQEEADFDASFPDILPANYRKLSPTVLQLRSQEKHLVQTKRYQEAIAFRERADRLEQQELEQQRNRFVKAFHDKRQGMFERHAHQLECLESNWERKFFALGKDRDFEVGGLRNAIEIYKKRIMDLERGVDDGTATIRGPSVVSRGPMNTSPLSRSRMRSTPAAVHPRVRSVAATKMARAASRQQVRPTR